MKPKRVLRRRRTNRRGTLTRRRGSSSVRSAAGGLNSGMNCIKIGLPGKLSSVGEKVFGKYRADGVDVAPEMERN